MVIVTCNQCGQKYALPDEAAGTTKKCRKCQKPIDVPRTESASPTPPRRLVLRPPRRQRPVFWMMIGAAITAVSITGSQFIWHRLRPPLEDTTQLYRPLPVDSELVHLDAAGQMYNETISAIVFIEKYKDGRCRGHGSGFFLSPGNKIVTNYHVIADADYVLIETYWRQQLRVDRYLAVDRYRDLAILPSPRSIKPDSLQLATRSHAVGERVYTMGSPKSVRFGISEGVIVSMGNLQGSFPGFDGAVRHQCGTGRKRIPRAE